MFAKSYLILNRQNVAAHLFSSFASIYTKSQHRLLTNSWTCVPGKQPEHLKNGHRVHPIKRERREALPVGIKRSGNNQWAPGNRKEASPTSEGHTCKANSLAREHHLVVE
jgi:hypothetical protein